MVQRVLLFLVLAAAAAAQTVVVGGGSGALLQGNPPGGIGGACTAAPPLAYLDTSGNVITCPPSLVWTVSGGGGSSPWSSSTGVIFPTTLTDRVGLGTNAPQGPLDILHNVTDNADEVEGHSLSISQEFSGNGADVAMEGVRVGMSYTGSGNAVEQTAIAVGMDNDGIGSIGLGIVFSVGGLHGANYDAFYGVYVAGSQTGNAGLLCGVCIGDMTLGDDDNIALQTGVGRVDFGETPTFPTADPGDNSTSGATTEFVTAALPAAGAPYLTIGSTVLGPLSAVTKPSGSYAWLNQNGSTVTTVNGAQEFSIVPTAAVDHLTCYMQTIPGSAGADYTGIIGISGVGLDMGVGISDGTKIITMYTGGGQTLIQQKWNSTTSFNSGYWGPSAVWYQSPLLWVRIQQAGATRTTMISADGKNWILPNPSASQSKDDFLTETQFGMCQETNTAFTPKFQVMSFCLATGATCP